MKNEVHCLISAGPTREWLDPVRFISNPSSGKMGYALANAAAQQGAEVTLISGPTTLPETIDGFDFAYHASGCNRNSAFWNYVILLSLIHI